MIGTGTYRGNLIGLAGKTALLRKASHPDMVLAQFDDKELAEAFGWWPFARASFDIRPFAEEQPNDGPR